MKSLLRILIACALGFSLISQGQLFAQENQKAIEITNKKGVYKQNNTRLTPKQLVEITKPIPDAYRVMKKAKNHADIATVFGAIGGGLIGWSIGSSLSQNEFNYGFLTVGGIFIACAIPFVIDYNNRSRIAVEHYNSRFNMSEYKSVNFNLAFTANGLGFILAF